MIWLRQLLSVLFLAPILHAATTITLNPTSDAFTSANNAANNYGGAGALNVSGSTAKNGSGVAQGVFDTFMMFDVASAVSSFNSAYGAGNWTITGANLLLTEQSAPPQTLFNRGTGTFQINWIPANSFPEGTGTPNIPTTDGINYSGGNNPQSVYIAGNVSLGTNFSNSGVNNQQESFVLPLTNSSFTSDLGGGGGASNPVGFYLTNTSSSIGFTFYSKTGATPPVLSLTASAAPEPSRDLLALAAGAGLLLQRRRPTRLIP